MKKLSKVLSVICALVLVASLGVTAFAAGVTIPTEPAKTLDQTDNTDTEITVEVKGDGTVETKYCVGITYEDLAFVYNITAPGEYDPLNHSVTPSTGSWEVSSKKITIQNHSNAEVFAKAVLVGTDGVSEYVEADGVKLTLDSAALGNGQTAIAGEDISGFTADQGTHKTTNDKEITVSVTGNPSNAHAAATEAKLKVTVSSTAINEAP